MKAINGYWVSVIFKVSDIYLIDPAKNNFRKFPKIAFLKNVLILPLDIYLIECTQVAKIHFLCQHQPRIFQSLWQLKNFLGLPYERMICLDEFKPKKKLKIENWQKRGFCGSMWDL